MAIRMVQAQKMSHTSGEQRGLLTRELDFPTTRIFKSSKESFLRNTENKQNFLLLLGEFLMSRGISVVHARDDADCLIVQTVIASAISHTTVVIGEDTDLLILLCYHVNMEFNNNYFRSDSSTSTQKYGICKKRNNYLEKRSATYCHLFTLFQGVILHLEYTG